ncbi:MAG: lactate utilization protein [Phocaeicola sp.]|uniref:lactate utilization protein n=1 Tax=Phocaeicola sp. TaxID=2773926 RepID=UPI003F9F087B
MTMLDEKKSPRELRNDLLAQKLIKNLNMRHYDAYYCPTAKEALRKALKIIPKGCSISWGGSMSIRDMGLTEALKNGDYQVFDRDDVTTQEDKARIYRKAFECDFYLAGVNAISEDGIIVNIDSNGNRVAAITFGPEHVLLVVGMNKVCQDIDAAVKRARSTAAPINMARFDHNQTPCKTDGICHNCKSPDSICNYISIMRMSHPAKRHIVLLVGEDLGY